MTPGQSSLLRYLLALFLFISMTDGAGILSDKTTKANKIK